MRISRQVLSRPQLFSILQVLLGVSGYTMICFMFNMLDELTPIFAAAPISRGGESFVWENRSCIVSFTVTHQDLRCSALILPLPRAWLHWLLCPCVPLMDWPAFYLIGATMMWAFPCACIMVTRPCLRTGLDFSSSQLSLPLSISGVALMVWSLVFFPIVQRCLGARACAVFGLASTVFLSIALGCTSYLAQANTAVSGIVAALTVILVLKACVQQLCFPTSMVRALPSWCNP